MTNHPTPEPDFTSPLAGRIEVREPCPWCPDRPMIARTQMDEHVAQAHPDVQVVDAACSECGCHQPMPTFATGGRLAPEQYARLGAEWGHHAAPAAVSVPPPAPRADALREAAGRYEEILANANTGQDPRYWTAVRDITLGLRAMADEAQSPVPGPCVAGEQQNETPEAEVLRCVCGDPVQLMDENDPTSWIHSPGSDTRCLEARPRCPHCQMPHDLTPGSLPVATCAGIRHRIAEAERSHAEGDHSLCCRRDCEVLRQS